MLSRSFSRFVAVAFFSAAFIGTATVSPGQQPTAAPPGVGPQPAPQEQPPPAKVEGPMRVEYMGIMDYRCAFVEPAPERAPKPQLRILFKLTGEKLGDLYRAGRTVIEELTDDTGAKLFDPATLTEKDKSATAPVNLAGGTLQQGYHMLDLTATPCSRTAKKIATAKGYVNIVFGGPTEEVTVENPLQYLGKVIDHPKLKELGVNVRVLKMGGEEASEPNDGRGLAIVVEPSDEQVKSIDFFDENMKKIAARPRDGKSDKIESYKFYALAGGMVNADTQMVLTVFKKIEKQKIAFDLKDIAIP